MTMVDEGAVHPRGEALLQELLWIHGIIRSNLEIIKDLSDQINNGAPVAQIRAQLNELASTSVVWTLRVNCLQYCNLVHTHHHLEDVAFFPGLRRVNPGLCPVIDKLEADHVIVARYLDQVETAAAGLGTDEAARAELIGALRGLAGHLLTHLDYEETSLAPTLRRLTGWPDG
jgi:hypothetical protein